MFEGLERKEQYALVGAAALLAAVSFGAGTTISSTPTGAVTATSPASQDQIRQQMQSFMDQQVQRQQQQLRTAANRSANLTMDDLGINAQVTSVEQSRFAGLFKVNVSVSGTTPQRLGSGTRDVNQQQVFFVSKDGRFLFQQPRDLEQPRRTLQRQPPTGGQ
jgi:pyruvate kinase